MLKKDVVRDACRSFEDYMIHMIVEEGKIDDLMDMEELLYYWNNLKDPIFIDLVTRFYGELCTDLFPSNDDGWKMIETGLIYVNNKKKSINTQFFTFSRVLSSKNIEDGAT